MSAAPLEGNATDRLLAEAHDAAASGHAAQSIAIARGVLDAAVQQGDERTQAQAMVAMANCELRVIGQFRQAFEHAQRAAFLFERVGDTPGECAALGTLAIAATWLAQHEDAVECGLLGVRLAETLSPGRDQVMAYHCLGLASYFGKVFDQAVFAYDKAIAIALACSPALNTLQLHVNQAVTECMRYFNERALHGDLPSLDRLAVHVAACDRLLQGDPGNISMTPASHWNNLVIKAWASTLLFAWGGKPDAALMQLDTLDASSDRLKRSWLGTAVSWARAEVALARVDLPAAALWAKDMHLIADYYGHEALCISSYQLASYVHEMHGLPSEAIAELHRMELREQKARSESLKSRARVIEWQIDLREKKASIRRLEQSSEALELMALHDSLTGLANRRQFESRLAQWLQGVAVPHLYLALVDVDRFKHINDDFSHGVGDAVLTAIAHILKSQLREGDLPARLGGDEFVVVLRRMGSPTAEELCTRIREAVRAYDWATVADGLAVTISIGVSAAIPGDTVATLMQRSDAEMYVAKRRDRGERVE